MAQVCPQLLVLVLAAGCAHAPAQAAASGTSPLTLGETFQLESKILGERRTINAYLPPSCAQGAVRCPVLYMPDGGVDEDFPHILGSLDVSIKNQIFPVAALQALRAVFANDGKFILLIRRAPGGPWQIAADMDNGNHRR